jgi:EF-hand domain-containing protein 1
MSSNLPLLPGHRFNDPYQQNFHKNQVFHFKTKTCHEKPNLTEVIDPYTISGLSILTSSVTSDRLKSRDTTLNESYPRILPQWIKNDKKVLKFNTYFVEHVVESAYENYRIRKCDIYYYLDDDTIHITEVKEENSGIPQGQFLKRHKIEKVSGSQNYISYRDFNLRSEISIYGKKFRICDCDDFTKKFYYDNNIPLNPPEPIPKIPGDDKFANVDMIANGNKIADLKEYIEVKLGGGHPNKILKQFLENDRKVLNFDIVWYDERYDKEEKFYKLHYFLSNGNVKLIN